MDILGIGNALLDIFWFSDDESALSLGLHPNHAAHVPPERLDELLLAIPAPISVSGGSASNSVKVAAALGSECAFVGCVGTDDRESDRWARIFRSDLAAFGVQCLLENRQGESGRCLVIHMPGGMKSIACAPGVAPSLRAEQISRELIAQAKIVLLDGQTLRNADVSERVIRLCRERRVPLALDAGSIDITQKFPDRFLDLLAHGDCVLFLNDDEALSLATALEPLIPGDRGVQKSEDYIDSIFSFFTARNKAYPCIVQKRGPRGARAWMAGASCEAGTEEIAEPLDDTGAGDAFNGAFLSAWLRHKQIPDALRFANAAAREVLMIPGTRLAPDRFLTLREDLRALGR